MQSEQSSVTVMHVGINRTSHLPNKAIPLAPGVLSRVVEAVMHEREIAVHVNLKAQINSLVSRNVIPVAGAVVNVSAATRHLRTPNHHPIPYQLMFHLAVLPPARTVK